MEGSKATAKLTTELPRSFISQQRLPQNNQVGVLIDAVKTVGAKLTDANPIGESDDEDDAEQDDHPVLSASAVATTSRNALRPPSLHTLLEDMPHAATAPQKFSSVGDSE
ncbi:hypothetical protein CDL12_27479 [Handroanthus impetiginosus]|uniref:Uncharacterized protein n=1 Tax=Handroanthus impetiginosus TaxID=429701 RepID=A0A2G9G4A5_9LAMI|nr:hypothetical protein CDL12_27479 [Handroanthus impetiginosus]